MHKSITFAKLEAAFWASQGGLQNPGFCVDCGAENTGVEPDARQYECHSCGAYSVYGAEEIMLRLGS